MPAHEKINYLEFPAQDLAATKQFFSQALGWAFVDYGPDYMAFNQAGVSGGFYRSNLCSKTQNGAALVVLYSQNLEQTQQKIQQAGGVIVKATFDFPGGRRFHFSDPNGNEYAVWSDRKPLR